MTTSKLSVLDHHERRCVEARQFQVYMWLGFAFFLPVVAVNRVLKWRWQGRRFAAAPRSQESIISETKAEVQSALAFVFSA